MRVWLRWRGTRLAVWLERRLAFMLGALGLVSLVVLAMWPIPIWLVDHLHLQLKDATYAEVLGSARTASLTAVAGLVGVLSVSVAVASFRSSRLSAFTDRYAKAVEQLGSSNRFVRVGGVHALGRLAEDSSFDRRAVVDVLATFARETAGVQDPEGEASRS